MEWMDGSVPQDLLIQHGQICVFHGHCPFAVGWQPAGLASHGYSQASVFPFVKTKQNKTKLQKVVRFQSNSIPRVCNCSYQALGPHQALERTVRLTECLSTWSSPSRGLSSSPLCSVGGRRIPSLRHGDNCRGHLTLDR